MIKKYKDQVENVLQIFWGSVFLLFDINASVYGIDILPDFTGWILTVFGICRLSRYSKAFNCIKIAGIFMTIVSLVQFVISFLDKNYIYTYFLERFGIGNAETEFVLTNAFWGIKLIAFTLLVFAFYKAKDCLGDIHRIKILGTVWLAILIIEIFTFSFNNFIVNYLPDAIQKAIMQILVVGVIFFKIWFVYCVYKISKVLRSSEEI